MAANCRTKWLNVLRAAQRYVRQIPDERLTQRVIDNRDRSIRLMSHHIFRIAEAFLETVIDDVEYRVNNANVPPAEGTCTTGAEIVRHGDGMIARVEQWWDRLEDESCRQNIKTFYGTPAASRRDPPRLAAHLARSRSAPGPRSIAACVAPSAK